MVSAGSTACQQKSDQPLRQDDQGIASLPFCRDGGGFGVDAENRGKEAGVRLGWKEISGADDIAAFFRSQERVLPVATLVERV